MISISSLARAAQETHFLSLCDGSLESLSVKKQHQPPRSSSRGEGEELTLPPPPSPSTIRFPWAPFLPFLVPKFTPIIPPTNDSLLESPGCLEASHLHGWPLLPLLPIASLLLSSLRPIPIVRAEDKVALGSRNKRSQSSFLLASPDPAQLVTWGEDPNIPGRKERVQSKLALSQNSAWVSVFSLLRNWAKFGQKPTQNPVLEYVSIPHLCLLSLESSGGQRSCSHTGISAGWLDNTSSPGTELELSFSSTESTRDLVLESTALVTEKSVTGVFSSTEHA